MTDPARRGPVLVDTDVATWLLTGAAQAEPWQPILRSRLLAISFATFGELMALPVIRGWGSSRTGAWESAIRTSFVVLPHNAEVAKRWASMHAKLRGHLHAQGTNDLWTAATALTSDPVLPIATNNLSDFSVIADGFGVEVLHPSTIRGA